MQEGWIGETTSWKNLLASVGRTMLRILWSCTSIEVFLTPCSFLISHMDQRFCIPCIMSGFDMRPLPLEIVQFPSNILTSYSTVSIPSSESGLRLPCKLYSPLPKKTPRGLWHTQTAGISSHLGMSVIQNRQTSAAHIFHQASCLC